MESSFGDLITHPDIGNAQPQSLHMHYSCQTVIEVLTKGFFVVFLSP